MGEAPPATSAKTAGGAAVTNTRAQTIIRCNARNIGALHLSSEAADVEPLHSMEESWMIDAISTPENRQENHVIVLSKRSVFKIL
jgi:hypothetical protein